MFYFQAIAKIKALGVVDKEIATSNMSIQAKYNYDYDQKT